MDAGFETAVRDMLVTLAAGSEPTLPAGGALDRVLRAASPTAQARASVAALADRWFRPSPPGAQRDSPEPFLNRPDVGESEKLHAVIREHVVGQMRWQELSSNESTFYRYRRAALAAFAERLWSDAVDCPFPTNRPRPEYGRFVGRQRELSDLLRLLTEPGGTVVGVEGPGGSGKTALLHAVADVCEAAARRWEPTLVEDGLRVPVFDAIVWVAPIEGRSSEALLDAVARTLDYPGLLARSVEDRRQAVRDLLSRRTVLLLVDDVDQMQHGVLALLTELPGASRALVTARRRLPAEVRALMPEPLTTSEVRELLVAEAERQGAPAIGRALADTDSAPEPLLAAARYPLLAGWAVGQLRRGQTVERVRERLARAEGGVFAVMFAASVDGLSPAARSLLTSFPLLPAPLDRAAVLALGGAPASVALDELLETSLLEVSGAPTDMERRYGLHTVTQSFVRGHLHLSAREERAAILQMAAHYAQVARVWGGGTPNWQSYPRLEAELPNIMAIVEAAGVHARDRDAEPPGAAFDEAILGLAHGMRNVFSFGRASADGLRLFHRAMEAAQRLGDVRAEGWNTYRLGALHYDLGTNGYGEAAQRAREAVVLLGRAGDHRGRGHALRLLGRTTRDRGNVGRAEELLSEAEILLETYGDGDDLAIVQASQADLFRLTGRLESARALYEHALRRGLQDPGTAANIQNDLGEIALARGNLEEASRFFAAAEQLAQAAGARAIVARCVLGQARVADRQQRASDARALATSAVDLFERLGDLERAYEARALVFQEGESCPAILK